MTLFLTLLSGIAWTIVYIQCIRIGYKQKTYCMPLFALALNIAWEGIYSFLDLQSKVTVQTIANIVWFFFDIAIVISYFKFGKKDFPQNGKKYFIPFSILTFASCFLIQLAFYWEFGHRYGARYSAFLQNVIMSILFVVFLFQRGEKRGQDITIAIAKWIGTLAPAILMGIIQEYNVFILVCGLLCSIFDILYIIFLIKWDTLFPISQNHAKIS